MAIDWGGIIGGVGGLLGGLFGDDANEEAAGVARQNLKFQREIANRILDAQLGSFVDARGNTVRYDPATKTWTTDVTPITQSLIEAGDAEQLQRLTSDAALRRSGMGANATRRADEGALADALLDQFGGPSPYSRESLEGLLSKSAMFGIDDAYDGVIQDFSRQALRTGSTGTGTTLAGLASQRAKDTSRALTDAQLQAYGLYEDLEGKRSGRLGNSYNMMASRASNYADVPFQPSPIADALSGTMTDRSRAALGAGQVASSGVGNAYGALANPDLYQSGIPGMVTAAGGILADLGLFDSTKYNDTAQSKTIGNKINTPKVM